MRATQPLKWEALKYSAEHPEEEGMRANHTGCMRAETSETPSCPTSRIYSWRNNLLAVISWWSLTQSYWEMSALGPKPIWYSLRSPETVVQLKFQQDISVQAQNLLVNQERTQATKSVKGEGGPLEHWCGKIMLRLMKLNYSTTHANLLL